MSEADTFDAIAKQVAVPASEVTVVLTDDLIGEVKRLDTSSLNETFTAERVGGVVAAKNIPLTNDCSRVAIVFASEAWRGGQEDASGSAVLQFAIVAHEFAHPLLIRAPYAPGVMSVVNVPARTAAEQFRASGRAAWDGYRADLLAYKCSHNGWL